MNEGRKMRAFIPALTISWRTREKVGGCEPAPTEPSSPIGKKGGQVGCTKNISVVMMSFVAIITAGRVIKTTYLHKT